MVQFYDEREKLASEEIDYIIYDLSDTDDKELKREFFVKYKYIMYVFTEKERSFLSRYYGIYDGNFMTYTDIGKMYGCTSENVRQIIRRALKKLHNASVYKLIANNSDKCKDISLDGIYQYVLHQKSKDIESEIARFESLPNEDKEAEMYLDIFLNFKIDNCSSLVKVLSKTPNSILVSNCVTIKDLLEAFTLEDLYKQEYSEFVNFIHSYGLIFNCEKEYYCDWKNKNLEGIKSFGVDLFRQEFRIKELYDNLEKLLSQDVREISNLNSTIISALRIKEMFTVEDLISMKKSQLLNIRHIGVAYLVKLINAIEKMGLSFCPEDTDPKIWKGKLRSFIPQKVDTIKDDSSEKLELFQQLLDTKISDLDLSLKTYDCLIDYDKETLGDIAIMTEHELMRIREIGYRGIREIINKLGEYGFWLRPEDKNEKDHINSLKINYYQLMQDRQGKNC